MIISDSVWTWSGQGKLGYWDVIEISLDRTHSLYLETILKEK